MTLRTLQFLLFFWIAWNQPNLWSHLTFLPAHLVAIPTVVEIVLR